jgi:DNA-binding CsgD family transcriptional regulator
MDEVVRQGMVSADMWRAWHRLLPRQRELLGRRLRGESCQSIARQRGCSPQAVEDACRKALRRLGVYGPLRGLLGGPRRQSCRERPSMSRVIS